jgi:hypothetical protein
MKDKGQMTKDEGPMTQDCNSQSSIDNRQLAAASVPIATPQQAANEMTNPWILLKVKALGELVPEAGLALETMIDRGLLRPHEISAQLMRQHRVRLSELEVARYGAWLPHLRRDAGERAEALAERNVQEVRERRMRQP